MQGGETANRYSGGIPGGGGFRKEEEAPGRKSSTRREQLQGLERNRTEVTLYKEGAPCRVCCTVTVYRGQARHGL